MTTRALRALLLLTLAAALHPHLADAQQRRCFDGLPWGRVCVEGRFLSYWEAQGGLAQFGYPLGPARYEQTAEGSFLVQHFERQRFELHPASSRPYDVMLGRLGDELLRRSGRDWVSFPRDPQEPESYPSSGAGCRRFEPTGFRVCEPFISAWRANGLELDGRPGLSDAERTALWGLPISPPQWETNSSGDRVVVQWFERMRFEDHGGQLLFGRLGAELALEQQRPEGTLVRGERLWEYRAGGLTPWQPHGINYNPPWAPWALWEQWDAARVAADLDRIAALRANVLRVALPWRNFRRSAPLSPLARAHFGELVRMARERGLRLIPILVDEYCKFGKPDGGCWSSWPWDDETAELLEAIPSAFRNSPTIALWEIANEPGWISPEEWSWQGEQRRRRLEWLRQAAQTIRRAAPYQPLTVGVSFVHEARDVIGVGASETITLHYYPELHHGRPPLEQELAQLAAIKLPLLVGEIGLSSSTQLQGSDEAQARFLCRSMESLQRYSGGFLWWHLQAWGDTGWESQLGLYREDFSLKPAALAFADTQRCRHWGVALN